MTTGYVPDRCSVGASPTAPPTWAMTVAPTPLPVQVSASLPSIRASRAVMASVRQRGEAPVAHLQHPVRDMKIAIIVGDDDERASGGAEARQQFFI